MRHSWFGYYLKSLESIPAVPGGVCVPTLMFEPCGGVFDADSDEDAVQKFWAWFYELPEHFRPTRDVTVRAADGRVLLERWHWIDEQPSAGQEKEQP